MGGVWGNKIKLSIFGESHGEGIGIVIDGIEPGIKINMDNIEKDMERRAPGIVYQLKEKKGINQKF